MNTDSEEKPFRDQVEPFPDVPGVYRIDNSMQARWGVVVEHLIKKEEDRCEVWRDEVQNITIYAGLFSAVVTAFILEAYRTLEDNPSEVLLSRIATALERGANMTNGATDNSVPEVPVSLSVSSATKVVSALWFMSLVLSLSSALIGLVGLQWLREHLRPSTRNVPLKTLPAIINMQAESLDAYFVPQTFTALPLLLIISIVLFFVGMIQFLWSVNHTVAYPSIITISLILAFILYTTIRPGLQGLPGIGTPRFRTSKTKSTPSVPCPYRSPQSWAFLQIIVLISSISSFILPRRRSSFKVSEVQSPRRVIQNWLDWAVSWPRIRDIDQLRSNGSQPALLQSFCDSGLVFSPVYDTVRALTRVKQDFSLMGSSDFASAMANASDAFSDFLYFRQGSQGFTTQLLDYVHEVLDEPSLPMALPKEFLSHATKTHKENYAELLFLASGVANLNDLAASVTNSVVMALPDLVELICDHLGDKIYTAEPIGLPIALAWYAAPQSQLSWASEEDQDAGDLEYVKRLLKIVEQILRYASEETPATSSDTIGTSPDIRTMLHAIANIVVDRATINSQAAFPRDAIRSNDELLSTILSYLQQNPKNRYLFLLASIYTHFLLVKVSPRFTYSPFYVRTKAFNKAADLLKRFHARLHSDQELCRYQEWIFPDSLEPSFTWAYLDPQYDQELKPESDGSRLWSLRSGSGSSLLIPHWLFGDSAEDSSSLLIPSWMFAGADSAEQEDTDDDKTKKFQTGDENRKKRQLTGSTLCEELRYSRVRGDEKRGNGPPTLQIGLERQKETEEDQEVCSLDAPVTPETPSPTFNDPEELNLPLPELQQSHIVTLPPPSDHPEGREIPSVVDPCTSNGDAILDMDMRHTNHDDERIKVDNRT